MIVHLVESRQIIPTVGIILSKDKIIVKKKTVEDYHALAESCNLKWIGKEIPPNITMKTLWECLGGHRWETRYHSIHQGSSCPYCAGIAPKTEADYHLLAKTIRYEWLGPFPLNTRTKTNWKCPKGHIWNVCYNSIQQGRRCRHCAGQTPKIPKDYHKLAQKYGFEWLGPLPNTTGDITWWQCQKNHRWQTRYDSIKQGKGCPHCYGNVPKNSKDYYKLAEERNFKWIGSFPPNVTTVTDWECPEGHRWQASYNNVNRGTGCPVCAIKIRADKHRTGPAAYHALAKKRGFKWIAEEVPSAVLEKTLWECENGHQWEASYNNVRFGSGCTTCIDIVNGALVSQIQRNLCEMIGGELNYPCLSFNIDVALPNDRIAIEYDSWYWHGGRLEDDKQRDQELLGAGWRILHIRSNNKLPTKAQLDNAIVQLQSGKVKAEIVLGDWGHGPIFTGFT